MLRVHHIIFYWDHCRRGNWSLLLFYDEFLTLWLLNVSGNKKKKVRKKKSNTCSLIEIQWKLIFTANHFLMIKVFPCRQQKRLEESRTEVSNVAANNPSSQQSQQPIRLKAPPESDLGALLIWCLEEKEITPTDYTYHSPKKEEKKKQAENITMTTQDHFKTHTNASPWPVLYSFSFSQACTALSVHISWLTVVVI